MKDIEVIYLKNISKTDLKDPVMIVGLPGVGNVGKFAADYLVKKLNAETLIEIYSKYFPPQVLIESDNTVSFFKNKICIARTNERDYLFLIGDYQSNESKGHYELCEIYVNIAVEYRVNMILTLGGYPTNSLPNNSVIGSVNDVSLIDYLSKYGIEFKKFEPLGGIVGISGMILAFASVKKIKSACIMGVTSGYIADPKASRNLLLILSKMFEIEIDGNALESQIIDFEKIIENIKENQYNKKELNKRKLDDDLIYFG